MKRMLCLISGMNAGGAETFLMKLYRFLDKDKYQMDFCVNIRERGVYDDEIEGLGGRIYHIPSKSESVAEFKKQLTKLIRDNNYQYVMRVTSSAMGFMDLHIAKKAGARVCIARSSNSSDGGSLKSAVVHKLGRLLYGHCVDVKIAPSDLAAEYTFGKKAYRSGKVDILHNALDMSVYNFNENERIKIRGELGIPDEATVIGHIGRFNQQKNHAFLLDVFAEYSRRHPESVLMLVGKGELEENIRKNADELKITDKIIFTGVRSDIPALLSAMDAFVFPSFYEGMPNTVIEAQATGLDCIIADTITREANITGLVRYLQLGNVEQWVSAVEQITVGRDPFAKRKTPTEDFLKNKYDIGSVVSQFTDITFERK